jgi:cytochrome c oxidase subunit III
MDNHKITHKYHLVSPSPLPFLASIALFVLAVGSVMFMHQYKFGSVVMVLGILLVLGVAIVWWSDVIKEGRNDHAHTSIVRKGLSLGMLMFIVSEIMFFVAFFWSFFHASIFPAEIIADSSSWPIKQGIWPPEGIKFINPWNIPFLNTLILLLSGTSITWAHYSLVENNQKDLSKALLLTVLLGLFFTSLQAYEYYHAELKWKDGIFSSNFYIITGFHGFHVAVGTIFLLVCYLRAESNHFVKGQGHLGIEFASWYWHFVDVIWLFLFVFIYIWGQ